MPKPCQVNSLDFHYFLVLRCAHEVNQTKNRYRTTERKAVRCAQEAGRECLPQYGEPNRCHDRIGAEMTKKKAQDEYKLTQAQLLLGIHLKELRIPFEREYKFCERDWRFDLVLLPDYRIAIEISGGNWTGGHRRGKAQEDEYDKLNHAAMDGWRVLQYTNAQVLHGQARADIARWFGRVVRKG